MCRSAPSTRAEPKLVRIRSWRTSLQQLEQRARQQDGEEIHQADEEFLGVEVHVFCSLSLGFRTPLERDLPRGGKHLRSQQFLGNPVVGSSGMNWDTSYL